MTHPDTQTDKEIELNLAANLFIAQRGDGVWLVCVEKVHTSMEAAQAACAKWKSNYLGGSDRYAAEAPCNGCDKPLLLENAWMEDGCPCNTPAGVNNHNLYRWKLLHDLQQQQAARLAVLEDQHVALQGRFAKLNIEREHQYTRAGDAESAPPTERAKAIEECDAESALAAERAKVVEEHAWLIEAPDARWGSAYCWQGLRGILSRHSPYRSLFGPIETAIRFSRKEDAERVIEQIRSTDAQVDMNLEACEHIWCALSPRKEQG